MSAGPPLRVRLAAGVADWPELRRNLALVGADLACPGAAAVFRLVRQREHLFTELCEVQAGCKPFRNMAEAMANLQRISALYQQIEALRALGLVEYTDAAPAPLESADG